MDENYLVRAVDFDNKAFGKKLISHRVEIWLSVIIIIITIVLYIFYPAIAKSERNKFLIGSIWPSGIIVILIPLWTGVVRDIRENVGYKVYELIEEEIKEKFSGEQQNGLLGFLLDMRSELTTTNKSVRIKTLTEVLKKIEQQ